ncbi:MAG: hypothetical protein K1X47_10700 [Cyclobacteriaceae bacterium]|nr:hypothetical protein [Cyclobacteriaceae bacterium]
MKTLVTPEIKRVILRWTHLIAVIPLLGYVYGDPQEVVQYASAVRFFFVPAIMLTGYWMYAGFSVGVIGVALWLVTNHYFGSGTAILSQFALFATWKIWQKLRKHS